MTKIHDKVISESNKPSLKKAKAEVKKATLVLTSNCDAFKLTLFSFVMIHTRFHILRLLNCDIVITS